MLEKKDLSGYLLIDKPVGISSFGVIAKVRKAFNLKRVGHTGTLDPLASGLMVVAVNKANRMNEFHVSHTKEYIAEIEFGKVSETYDSEGPITETSFKGEVQRSDLEKVLTLFRGKISQVPPKYSALKVNGKKLCNLVREGKEVDVSIKKREITIHALEIINYQWPYLSVRVACSSGTYIRSLAFDIGEKLTCGAYLKALRRTKVDDFSIEEASLLEEISPQDLLPMDAGLSFEKLILEEDQIQKLLYGQKLSLSSFKDLSFEESKIFQVYDKSNEYFGLAEMAKNALKPKKMIL